MNKQLIFSMDEKFQEYLMDESKLCGYADSISFPENEEEIVSIVKKMSGEDVGITIQSGKTGIVGGAVPKGGHILNMSRMTACKSYEILEDGSALLTVEAGISLLELNNEINRIFKKIPMLWPPQPTEASATVGGILALSAQGINACHYGDSRQYIKKIRMVLSNGTIREIERGKDFIKVGEELPDELDLILGGEGIFGVITEAQLLLLPKPENIWGISFFFEALPDIGRFAALLSDTEKSEQAKIIAMEFVDRTALDLVKKKKNTMTKLKALPDIDSSFAGMVYLELAGKENGIEELAEILMEAAMECGSDPELAWAVSGESEIEKMRALRHGVAETANLFIEEVWRKDDRITKLGTDMLFQNGTFPEIIGMYQTGMKEAGVQGCIFGHMKENHFHVNILPENYQEYQKGRELITSWAGKAAEQKGFATAEHGIGKLKTHLLPFTLSKEEQDVLRKLKNKYDRTGIWNRGNIFPENR